MAAKRRHWHEKGGRFWARIAIPEDLQPIFCKTQLTEPLGGDLRAADRAHAAAVARLQDQIVQARLLLQSPGAMMRPVEPPRSISLDDVQRAAWAHYERILNDDAAKRDAMPTAIDMTAMYDGILRRASAGELDARKHPYGMINASGELELMQRARELDVNLRIRRLAALRSSFAKGETGLIDRFVEEFSARSGVVLEQGSRDWRDVSDRFARAEIEALDRTIEKDRGNFAGQPSDPILKPPIIQEVALHPVPVRPLFEAYICSRQIMGKHRDGGQRWSSVIDHLLKFLKHADARKITKRNLLDWRDQLLVEGRTPKTVADVYLACVRAVLQWAFVNDRLPSNEAEHVRQEVAKKVLNREQGYTTPEAMKTLNASINYEPALVTNPANRESAHITAAKRWAPLLCAFSGARITEITQLRKEDVRQEGGHWIIRIAPDAGSVKKGDYRDVPLHRQVIALGFTDFVNAAEPGPLFHRAQAQGPVSAEELKKGARITSGRVSEWLNEAGLVPSEVQPNHGWRHRFKTQGVNFHAKVSRIFHREVSHL